MKKDARKGARLACSIALTTLAWVTCFQPVARAETASEILEATGIRGGLVVHLGCGDGQLTAALHADHRYVVQGLDPVEQNVQEANRHIASLGLQGAVSVKHWPHDFLPYADNLVNLVVSEDLDRISMDEIQRILVPKGIAYIKSDDKWVKTVKPWPAEIDEWTHWLHGPDNNPVARDTRVGPPRRVQWIASPRWPKSHDAGPSMTGLISAGGRVFYIADDGPPGIKHPQHRLERWALFARDAFNGVLLWKKSIENWGARAWSPDDYPYPFGPWTVNPRMIHKRLVACGDRVYVTLGFSEPISVLDAATGEMLATFADTGFASEILHDDGRIYAVVDRAAQKAGRFGHEPRLSVVAVDPDTGKKIWERPGLAGIVDRRRRGFDATLTRLYLTAGGECVFVVEDTHILALDAATGNQQWRLRRPERQDMRHPDDTHPVNDPYDLASMFYADDTLYFWQPHLPPHRGGFWQYRMELLAISTADGEILWKTICGGSGFSSFVSVYKAQGLVWVQSPPEYVPRQRVQESYDLLGLDPLSGKVVHRYSVEPIFQGAPHHHRCYQNKATEKYIMFSRNGIDFIDLANGNIDVNKWVRGVCQYGVMPANGLLYAPPQPCACFPSARLSGYYAFAADSEDVGRAVRSSKRLSQGPAYNQPTNELPAKHSDWPMYRHDPLRSGATAARMPSQWEQAWSVSFDEPITAPTVAQNKVFVATRDSHRVCALGQENGSRQWSYQAGNRVDSPPTISGGRVYFGTADGHVCCLRASDGALVWRLDANPEIRHVMSHGRVESAWPVHGSVLVMDEVAYACAGRSSYLDGGLLFYAVNANTGQVIRSNRYCSIGDEKESLEKRARGTFNDILVHDGRSLFLKNVRVDMDTLRTDVTGWSYIPISKQWPGSPLSAVGGFLDDSLFDRVGWILDHQLIAKMMVFNDEVVFGMKWRDRHTLWHGNLFHMDRSKYAVFARPRTHRKSTDASSNTCALEKPWAISVPVRVTAMTLTSNALLFAGPPWSGEPDDVSAVLDESASGLLTAVAPSNGKTMATYTLEAPPVWDGMAAADERLYICTKDHRVVCLGKQE